MTNGDKAVSLAIIVAGAIVLNHSFASNSLHSGGDKTAHMAHEAPVVVQAVAKGPPAVAVSTVANTVYQSQIQQPTDSHVARVNVKPSVLASAGPRDLERWSAIDSQIAQQETEKIEQADRDMERKDVFIVARAEQLAQQKAVHEASIAASSR